MKKSNYVVIEDDLLHEKPLVIRDIGPWDEYLSVTNDAENVVKELRAIGMLPDGRRLFYIDTEGESAEIVIKDGEFSNFDMRVQDAR